MKKLILTRTTGRLALVLLMLVSVLTGMKAEAIEDTSTFDSSVWGTGYKTVPDGQYWWNGNVKLTVGEPGSASNDITSDNYLLVMMSAKLTLTGQTGCYLTKFTITGSGDFALTTNTGTMTAVSGGYQWTGRANEVVISCGGDEYDRLNYVIQSISVTYEINLDDLATVTGTGTQYDFTSADALAGTSLHAKTITGGDVEMYLDGFQASTDPEIQQNMTTAGTFLHMPAGSRLWLQRSDNSSSVYVTKAVFTFVSGSPSISPDGGTYDSSTNTWTGKESQLIFSFNEDADIMLVESEAGSLFQVDITSYGRGTTTYDSTTIERGESTNNYMGTATTYMSGDQSMYLTFTPDARRYVYQATRIDGYVNETDITDEANAGSYTLSGLTDDCRIQVYYHLIYPNVTWGSNGNGSISFSGTGLDDQDEETFYDGEPVHEGNKTVGYPYGCTLTFTLLPDDGKELVMLMMNGQDVTDQVTENTFTVTLTQDIDIQAIFEQTAVPVAAPTLFRDGRLFALTTETENATIYYAVDYDMSQTAAPNFMVYSDADTHLLDGAANIMAYAIRDGYLDSETVVYNVTLEDMTARAPSDLKYTDGMVTLTVPDSCVVYYTTDGTVPSATNGTVYDNGIPITSNVTVQAVSVRDFWFDSPVVEYVVSDFQVAPVSFVQDGYRVTLSTTTEGATIHYTISNSGEGEQTCPSGTALSMNGDCSITAYATKEGFSQSEETVYVFTAADVTVATPTFNQTDNLVTITTTTENSTIYYTLDGSEPTTLSNVYAEPGIVVNGNVTVKAFATRPSWFSSPVVTYNVTGFQVAPVTFAQNGNQITLSTTTEDALIHYTLSNGALDEQTCPSGTVLTMTGDCTIMAYATKDGYTQSEPTNFVFYAEGVTVATPTFNQTDNLVTITTTTENSTIYYTLDGSEPTTLSNVYAEPGITVTSNVTVKALATRPSWFSSSVATYEVTSFQVAPVTFAQNGNQITLSTTTEDALIHYTLSNGALDEQTCPSGTVLTMTGDCTIMAYATKDGYTQSEPTNFVFNAADVTVATPTFNQTDNLVTITTTTENSTIYYTLDGSEPTTLSNVYAEPGIVVNGNVTVKAFATRPSWFSSPVVTYNVTGFQVAPVTFAQNGNQITLSTTTEDALIHYTLSNGALDEQTCPSGTVLTMTGDCTIMAYATKDGYTQSEPTNFVFYAEGVTCGTPVLDRMEGTNVITATTLTEGATIHYTTDGSDPTEASAIFPEGGLTVSHNQTIKAITLRDTYYPSQVSIFEVNWFQCEQPTFAWNGDALTISSTTVGEDNRNADILYTMVETSASGTIIPDTMSYNGPITVTSDVTITAIARLDGYNDSQEARLVYPYTAWKSLADAIANAQNVYAQSASSSRVTADMRSNLQTLTTQAEALYAERTADVDAINNMTSQLTIATSDIEALLEIKDAYAVLSENNTVLTFYYDNQKEARNGMSVGPFSKSTPSWGAAITTVVFDDSFASCTTLTSTAYWFYSCQSLQEITGLDKLNTANVTDMSYMFYDCFRLTSLDLSNFNTANVTNMQSMFYNCGGLTSLDLSSFNTANVSNMSWMFRDCSGLMSLDLSSFNTANVTNMQSMFYNCGGLTSLDLSSFNTANVTDMSYMFYDCSGLTSLDLSSFNTANVTDMSYMFSWCSGLTSLDLSSFNTTNVTNLQTMFGECDGLTSLDLSSFNTANVTDMSWMFSTCKGLTSLDLSSFNTSNVTNMNDMFYQCSGLTSLDLSSFNTANVTDMGDMFRDCSGLMSLDLSSFNTANVTNMSYMFYGCSGLTSLDLSSFNTANVTDMGNMFSMCSGLMSLDLSSFNTANVTNMNAMFSACSGLTTIYAGSEWSTASVVEVDGSFLFYGCTSLVGGQGTVFDADHTDYEYARIDGQDGLPGYLSRVLSKGDANGDGEVNIADAVMTVTTILGQPTDMYFHQDMADMNDDSEIDIFDVSMIVTAALNANSTSPAHGMINGIDNIAEEDVRLTKQNNRIYMGIDREGVFTAFQFDVTLPEGVELLGASLATGGTNHQLTFVKRGDNQYRVVGLSMTNEVFAASDGHLIQLQLSDSSAAGMAKVSNVLFINPVAKDATAIREHRSGEGDEDSIYNLKGQYLGKDRQKLGKGIYVINGKKVYIK